MRPSRLLWACCLCVLLAIPVSPSAQDQSGSVAGVDQDGVQRMRVIGGNYFLKPNRIVVKVNVPVELVVSREAGIVPHDFVINAPEAGIAVDQDLSTDTKGITFTPTAVGTYPFYCKKRLLFFKSHREQGMEGILEVVR